MTMRMGNRGTFYLLKIQNKNNNFRHKNQNTFVKRTLSLSSLHRRRPFAITQLLNSFSVTLAITKSRTCALDSLLILVCTGNLRQIHDYFAMNR